MKIRIEHINKVPISVWKDTRRNIKKYTIINHSRNNAFLSISVNPSHRQTGYKKHIENLGQGIRFGSLPISCQIAVRNWVADYSV